MASLTCGCGVGSSDVRCRWHAQQDTHQGPIPLSVPALYLDRLMQVGWMGPYGIIPGGMDVDAAPFWRPIFMFNDCFKRRGK